jgi:S-(hydroxymethyl)glutathione dehydrogenase/alcohol dehydrogenase
MSDEMITRTYPLDEFQHEFEEMLSGKIAKGVMVFE